MLIGLTGSLDYFVGSAKLVFFLVLLLIAGAYITNDLLFSMVSARFTKVMIVVTEFLLLYFLLTKGDWTSWPSGVYGTKT